MHSTRYVRPRFVQPHVVTALLRVLRMLIDHARTIGRDEHIPALRAQMQSLSDTMASRRDLHPADLARPQLISKDGADPAEHDAA